jgi:hypothetical protein
MFCDFLGNKLEVGDRVVCVIPEKRGPRWPQPNFAKCVILSFSKFYVKVEFIEDSIPFGERPDYDWTEYEPKRLIKINE